MRLHLMLVLCTFALIDHQHAFAQEKPDSKDAAAIHEVQSAPIKIEVKVSGVFESTETRKVEPTTEQLKSLVIERVIPHGTKVRQGQPIVWFETEDADKKLHDAEVALQLAELGFQESELAMQQAAQIQQLDRVALDRSRRNARQDFDYFQRVDRQQQQKSADFSLKSSQASLENALEELQQLEKMYKEDELTEESEEIVLKRARQSVENAKFRFEIAKLRNQQIIKHDIPRDVENRTDGLSRQELSFDKSRQTARISAQRKSIEFAQAKRKIEKQRKELAELRADRKHLVLAARIDGIFYYGDLDYGQVSDTRKPPTMNLAGKTVTNKQSLGTIANPAKMQIRIELEEKQLQHIRRGTKGAASPTAFPARSLPAQVQAVSFVPHAPNKYDCRATVGLRDNEPPIMPAMTCSLTFIGYQKEDAISVPDAAIHRDAQQRTYVELFAKGKQPKRQWVKTGVKASGKTEVISGLKVGDKVVMPKAAK